jgi:subtilase family serine protease
MFSKRARRFAAMSAFALAAAAAFPASAWADNVPPGVKFARDLGASNPAKLITINVHLKMPDQAGFDRTLEALYTPGSPLFHHWLTDADLRRFAPTATARAKVRATLESYGLAILGTDKNGFSIRARGTLADVARAFSTEIHDFRDKNGVFRANIRNASLAGEAGAFVHAVAGIESHTVRPLAVRASNPVTGKTPVSIPLAKLKGLGGFGAVITDRALTVPQAFSFTTPGQSLPTANYTGSVYDEDSNLIISFAPAQLQAVYNLPAAYKQGFDGAGQTIVLLEGYGYPTLQSDANAFSRLGGLPALNSANFSIVYPQGKPANSYLGVLTGWNIEIALDMDSSHTIAPGAKIVVVATNGQDNEDFQASMTYIIDHNIGNAVSDSWEEDQDISAGPEEQNSFERILSLAASKGISFQFSTGDGGDGGIGTPAGAPGVPASAPHATAVGGTALLNMPGTLDFVPVGWGDSAAEIGQNGAVDPPSNTYIAGGGGGESVFWPRPSWQSSLPGSGRQTPDISALADPYTGVPIVVTVSGTPMLQGGWGGTSLSSPIFTAIWAIANQKAGQSRGLAGPAIAALTTGLTDVLPLTSHADVSGSITDGSGTTTYSSAKLLAGQIPDNQAFIDAIWHESSSTYLAFAFALDSSLTVKKGWDNATGYGTPQDALAFITAAAAAAK